MIDFSWINKLSVLQNESYTYGLIETRSSGTLTPDDVYLVIGEQTKISDKIICLYKYDNTPHNIILKCPISNLDNPATFFSGLNYSEGDNINVYVKQEYYEEYYQMLDDKPFITVYPITEELKTTLGI